jgi:hypothetical protein
VADRAAARAAAGVVVIVTWGLEALTAADPVRADLGGGRRLQPASWSYVLARCGWADADVEDVPEVGGTMVVARRSPAA